MRRYGMSFAQSPVPPTPVGLLRSGEATASPVAVSRGGRRAGGRGFRWAGTLVAAAGVFLLCLAAGDALAGVELGGGGDNIMRGFPREDRLAGFNGADTLYGAGGDDALYGGAGDDFIEAKDGARDRVGCGPGTDSVSVDYEDLVGPDCEAVYVG